MAKIMNFPKHWPTRAGAIVEDPRGTSNNIYLYGTKHDKNSLTPYFGKSILHHGENTVYQPSNQSSWSKGGLIMGLKGATHVQRWYNTSSTNNASWNFPDESPWFTMDLTASNAIGSESPWREITDGSQTGYAVNIATDSYSKNYFFGPVPSSGEWEDVGDTTRSSELQQYYNFSTFWLDQAGGRYQGVTAGSANGSSNWNFYPQYYWSTAYSYPNPGTLQMSSSYSISGMTTYYTVQCLGKSAVDGGVLMLGTRTYGGTNLVVSKGAMGNSTTPTWTSLLSYSSTPTASGTHQGGSNLGGSQRFRKNCSHSFTDPRDSNKKAFYYPYFDSYGDFHPFVGTWDTTTDTVALEQDISVTGGMSTTHASLLSESLTYEYGIEHVTAVTWVSSGTRYVSYIPCDMAVRSGRGAGFKTLIVYSVDASNPKTLTYHSKITLSDVPRNFVWLNDSRTLLGLFYKSSFQVLSFSNATGWAVTTTVTEEVLAAGRDSSDRIWYCTQGGYSTNYADLNMLSPSLPVTVTISPENSSNQYTGSNISTYVDVSAYNTAGTRIATSVKLVIDSANYTFTDGTTTKTVTTLTSGELQVGTIITGAGYTNITASIQL